MALLFPMPNIMELGPPAFFIIRLVRYWPRTMKMITGRTQLSRMEMMGEVCSMISPVNLAPES